MAAATEYELITHVPWLLDTPRPPEIAGTATLVTVESRTSMNVASDSANVSKASRAPRMPGTLRSPAGPGPTPCASSADAARFGNGVAALIRYARCLRMPAKLCGRRFARACR